MFIMPNDPATKPGSRQTQVKIVGEVKRRDVVDRQFHPEARTINHEQRPDARIAAGGGKGPARCGLARSFPRCARSASKSPSAVS